MKSYLSLIAVALSIGFCLQQIIASGAQILNRLGFKATVVMLILREIVKDVLKLMAPVPYVPVAARLAPRRRNCLKRRRGFLRDLHGCLRGCRIVCVSARGEKDQSDSSGCQNAFHDALF